MAELGRGGMGVVYKAHEPGVLELRLDPFFAAFKHDPRFGDFCRTVGLPVPNAIATGAKSALAVVHDAAMECVARRGGNSSYDATDFGAHCRRRLAQLTSIKQS